MLLRARTSLASVAVVACLAGCSAGGAPSSDGTVAGDDVRSTESVRCADGTTVEGIDVSYYQGTVDWTAVKASGREFAIARIADGSYHDTQFAANWSGMKAAGLIRGAYLYFEPGESPTTQANEVISAVGVLGAGDLPVTLDVETTGGESAATIAANIKTWIAAVTAGTGKTPIIYTGYYFWSDSVVSSAFTSDALWIAAYGPTCPNIPTPWLDWKFFQYTDTATVPGISGGVDADKFNGTLSDLIAFAGGTGTTTGGGSTSGGGSGGTSAGLCYSNTLGKEVPLNTCVQSKSDSLWYQCAGANDWVIRWTDPAACASVHPL